MGWRRTSFGGSFWRSDGWGYPPPLVRGCGKVLHLRALREGLLALRQAAENGGDLTGILGVTLALRRPRRQLTTENREATETNLCFLV